jgi:CheY-like chemotaxis protein
MLDHQPKRRPRRALLIHPVRFLTSPMPQTSTSPPLVLVVEDDAFVRAMAVDALEEEGFEVLEAPSADYAVTVLESRSDIGVVFTDITMPGTLNGFDLARLVRRLYPRISVLVSSGALPSGFTGEAPDARFVPKLYRMTEVVRIIRGMTA